MRAMLRGSAVGGVALLGFLVGAPVLADVRVAYEVEQKTFKKGATSTNLLTFALYDDAACSNLVSQTDLAAGDAAVTYDQPKRGKVKGGPKPTKVTVIGAVLDPGAVSGPLYAVVTGAGVTPVGVACQVQAGTGPLGSLYAGAVGLNTTTGSATDFWSKLDDYVFFTKARDSTAIEVWMNTRANPGTFAGGASALRFQLRVADAEPDYGGTATLRNSNTIEFISAMAVFEGLPAGSHAASVWVETNAGTSAGVILDPGGWRGHIVVKEAD